jgi:hypothetical protein
MLTGIMLGWDYAGPDDSPWTDKVMDLLADEAGELLDRYEP